VKEAPNAILFPIGNHKLLSDHLLREDMNHTRLTAFHGLAFAGIGSPLNFKAFPAF